MKRPHTWPKQRPELTSRQKEIIEDWYGYWLGLLPQQHGIITRFNHSYPARTSSTGMRTLEIGAGNGEHLMYEQPDRQEYFALELRQELADTLHARFPRINVIVGDCQERIDVADHFFDRVIAIHVLEHLENLPRALEEVSRVLTPRGTFSVVIPCEGGLLYKLGRQLTSKRTFEKRYGVDYEWMISYDHVNCAAEILDELKTRFTIKEHAYFPFRVPSIDCNLLVGMVLQPRV